jgi:hypothetical protein
MAQVKQWTVAIALMLWLGIGVSGCQSTPSSDSSPNSDSSTVDVPESPADSSTVSPSPTDGAASPDGVEPDGVEPDNAEPMPSPSSDVDAALAEMEQLSAETLTEGSLGALISAQHVHYTATGRFVDSLDELIAYFDANRPANTEPFKLEYAQYYTFKITNQEGRSLITATSNLSSLKSFTAAYYVTGTDKGYLVCATMDDSKTAPVLPERIASFSAATCPAGSEEFTRRVL